MKYLKTYENHNKESLQDIVDNIKDICLDITDDGRFSITFYNVPETPGGVMKNRMNHSEMLISLKDPRDYDGFTLSEVEDVLMRIHKYLGLRRYRGCGAILVGDTNRIGLKNVTHGDRITNIKIMLSEDTSEINESFSSDINSMIMDITQDLSDEGYEIKVDEVFGDDPEEFIEISRIKHFKFKDIISTINELISQLEGNHFNLSKICYSVSTQSTMLPKWYNLSMDPTAGEIIGNKVLCIKHPKVGKNVNEIPIISRVRLFFTES